ncbi:chloride channel protein [Shinella sp. SUS2]|jgi:H+/Cl- antiporter ClcA|uniref:chloride channel protein n=1 Tax=unclassified Shinella TaxID=2643062 RepID=UPI0003C55373|nr:MULTISPECIES: chloride channel protein [unclassified Shinella]EYR84070.1 chloride channel core [Shinella sp. DD12]KNY13128.1 chloride channel protein [Shinella sp. SUS2]KOC71913.1 chloride channel protein [Shinella sp. GWS1]MDG4675543.1 chloride channel protein [Shinella sp. 838]TAA50212.1 chloride channel protein [Shinella sp. JR1-6]
MPAFYRKSKLLRRSRVFWGSFSLWRPRLIFWCGALAIGVVSVGFAKLADLAQHGFTSMTTAGEWNYLIPLLITPAGFALSAYLAMRFLPNAQGSGIPQAIAARHLKDEEDRGRLLSLRIAFGKILLTVFGLLCGASIGREGPTVQVGASIMLAAGRFGGMAQARGLILAGSAAGIAAAFNTPLAGIVFAIEEMGRTYEARTNGLVLAAVIISGLAALGLSGSYHYFGSTSVAPVQMRDWALVLACGIGGGALGAIFSGMAQHFGQRIRRWAQPEPMKRMVLLALCCGLAIAAIGVLSGGDTFGTGYEQAKGAVQGEALPHLFFLEKFAAGFLSMLSGIPGGIFAPSLSVGAGLGSTLGSLLGTSIALAAVLGMAGYFAGVVQAPMTAFVIILEMTGDHEAVIPIMAVSMLGYLTSRILSREPLYHGLSRVFIAAAIRMRRAAGKGSGETDI